MAGGKHTNTRQNMELNNNVVTVTIQVEWQKLLYRLMGLPDGKRHTLDIDIDRTGRPDRLVIHEIGRVEVLTRKS